MSCRVLGGSEGEEVVQYDDSLSQASADSGQNVPSRRRRRHSSSSSSIDNDPNKRARVGDPFEKGATVFRDSNVKISAKSVAHKRFTRFAVKDHLYNLTISNMSPGEEPLVLNISKALKNAIKNILDSLRPIYGKDLHHQVYITVIEKKILHGLNSGNYDLNTPSSIIANRVLSMLYNYLKSFQTLRINPSFKVQVKVLSVPHMAHMEISKRLKRKYPPYRKHLYYNVRH